MRTSPFLPLSLLDGWTLCLTKYCQVLSDETTCSQSLSLSFSVASYQATGSKPQNRILRHNITFDKLLLNEGQEAAKCVNSN